MATNPLIAQGTINRLRASIQVANYAQLNITAPYLGKAGINLALEGDMTVFIPTMTGTATSGEPYVMATITVNLIRSQALANTYKTQYEASTVIGDIVLTPDTTTLDQFTFHNCAIQSVRELPLTGDDAGFVVVIRGYYAINNNLWNLT